MYYDVLWCIKTYHVSSFMLWFHPQISPWWACPKIAARPVQMAERKVGNPPVLDVGEYSGISLDRMDIWYPIDEILGNIHITDEISLKYPYWLGNIWWNMFGVLGLGIWFAQLCVVLFRPWFAMLDRVFFFSCNSIPLVVRGNSPMIGKFFPFNENNQHSESVLPQNCFNQMVNQSLIGCITNFAVQSNPTTIQRYQRSNMACWTVPHQKLIYIVRWIFPLKWP